MSSLDSHNIVWNNCLEYIKTKVNQQSYQTWFEPIIPKKVDNETLTIQVPSQFFYEWLEEHHIEVLKDVIFKELGPNGKLAYTIVIDKDNSTNQTMYMENKPKKALSTPKGKSSFVRPIPEREEYKGDITDHLLNSKYTFDSLVVGSHNQFAVSAAQAVASKPGKTSFNPLLVYGNVGLGKTHLMHAIGTELQTQDPSKKLIYNSSDKFTNKFIDAIRHNKVMEFLDYYYSVDLLLIDDIQFLIGKEKTQDTFFQIFNHLYLSGKQIVLTSDCPPVELKGMQERLLSRFKWGLTADIHKPDFETRVAIIHTKMDQDNVHLADDLVNYIATCIDTNIRDLEGVLVSLIAHASLGNRAIDFDLVKKVLNTSIEREEHEMSVSYLQKLVAQHLKVEEDEIVGNSRKKEIVIARQIAMHLAKQYTNLSLKSIGEAFNGRHHSTVLHAMQAVEDMIDTDHKLKKQIESLKEMIKIKIPK